MTDKAKKVIVGVPPELANTEGRSLIPFHIGGAL